MGKRIKICLMVCIVATVAILSCSAFANAAADKNNGDLPEFKIELKERQKQLASAGAILRDLGFAEDSDAMNALREEYVRCEEIISSEYMGRYTVTGYDAYCKHCCSKANGITASGKTVVEGYTVAMSKDVPFGTRIYIEGLGVFEVQDRGVGKGHIDIALEDHKACYAVTGNYSVWVLD